MSRSNPTESMSHPSKRWIEYNGEFGTFRFYDKEAIKEDGSKGDNIDLGPKTMFLYLDKTYTVTGWSESNNCGIFSTEVKDIRSELSVKLFKGNSDPIVGSWSNIKDRVKAMGGKFSANIYIAFKGKTGELEIGVLQLRGAAYAAWNDFQKSQGKAIYEGAVKVDSHKDGKKGSVKFKTPIFKMMEISEESNNTATQLDRELQEYFKARIAEVAAPEPTPKEAPKEELTDKEIFGEDAPTGNTPPPPTQEDEPFDGGVDLDDDSDMPF